MPLSDQGLSYYKTEEEHKLEIEELGLRFQYGCYMDKLSESCYSLGVWFQNYKENMIKAVETFKWNCEQYNHPESCMKVALSYCDGQGIDIDLSAALNLFEKNCMENNHARSCYAAGIMKIQGENPDFRKGMGYLEKSCSLDFAQGCLELGKLSIEDRGEMMHDYEKSAKSWKKGCDLGDADSCFNLGMMYKKGHHFEQNLDKFEELYDQATKIRNEIVGGLSFEK